MELKEYTDEELKNELKIRILERKEQRKRLMEERNSCRNCINSIRQDITSSELYWCSIKIIHTKRHIRNKQVVPTFICDKYKRK